MILKKQKCACTEKQKNKLVCNQEDEERGCTSLFWEYERVMMRLHSQTHEIG